MFVWLSGDIQLIRIRKDVLITISRTDYTERHFFARNRYSVNRYVFTSITLGRHQDWRSITKQFLHRRFNPGWLLSQSVHRFGIFKEREHAISNQIDCRFMSGNEQ